jgi:hypothetical protein
VLRASGATCRDSERPLTDESLHSSAAR